MLLSEIEKIKPQSQHQGLVVGVKRSQGPNYLGDLSVVDTFIRNFLYEALNRRVTEADPDALMEMDLQACDDAADVFLGNNLKFTTIPKWNRPGTIDEWISKQVNLTETDPRRRLAEFFAYLLADYYALSAYITSPDAVEENYKWQLDALIQSYAELLIGVAQPTEQATA